jgi:hypothetical protein
MLPIQFRQLQQALLSAFPNRAKLKQMVRFGLDQNLDAIATGENDEEVVYKLIEWAQANGNLENLLIAARDQNLGGNPGNPQLKRICEELLQGQTAREQSQRQEIEKKEIFISYTWRDEHSKPYVEQLEKTFQAKGIKIIRDTNAVGYKERFKEFMQRIGRGKWVIAIITDQYLKSPNCMFELVEIAKNGEFYQRIFPIILSDAKISKAIERIKYIQYWEEEIKELDEAMKGVNSAKLQGIREDIDLYTDIRNTIAELTNLLRDMNTLTPEIHSQSEFEDLLKAIEKHLDE